MALGVALAACVIAACVTINVYFPAAAAEKAADQIIGDVIGKPAAAPGPPPTGSLLRASSRFATVLNAALAPWVPAANAASPDLNISSAAIRQITDSMKARHAQLLPYYQSGAVGYSADGLIEIRDATLIPLAQRTSAKKLVEDENQDRAALYSEIAKANGHPEWLGEIRATFAKRWLANAQPGWYYNNGSGWQRK